ncbi:MAG: dienelactone hydrolase family protein [Rhodospirillales bacterium]|jgi:carboxymethylenebutenolidase|nr:dienelactone hydrolase family protein [Rhodospirillales bacterium]MDP6804913.1 dienelactone hydrolase family protein [Rhodospirillales bacterium]
MAENIKLTASDGHEFDAYRVDPQAPPKAGLVVVQEIFGVNDHIRGICDGFAADGYAVVAPAIFDRTERGVELGYDEAGMARGIELRAAADVDAVLRDIAAAADAVRAAGKIGVVGYCWGGRLVWLSACRLDFDCAVGYYGGAIVETKDEAPRCATMLHFGDQDTSIPMADVDEIRAAQPDLPVHIYPAGHGFNCDQRGSYHAESAALARERTLAMLAEHLS